MDVAELASSFDTALSELKSFGYPQHRSITNTHECLADSLKDVAEIVKLVGNVVAYHAQVFERQSTCLYVEKVEIENDGWSIHCNSHKDKKVIFKKEFGKHGGRWKYGGSFIKEARVAEMTGATCDYIAGFEAGMDAVSCDKFEKCFIEKDAKYIYEVCKVIRENYREISVRASESMIHLIEQAGKIKLEEIPSDIEARKAAIKYERRMRTACKEHGMPEVPRPMCRACDAKRLEAIPGVYFEWDGDVCVYVGKAKNIKQRLAKHHKVQPTSDVSWIKFSNSEKDWAELFYIWLLRPCKNYSEKFGRED